MRRLDHEGNWMDAPDGTDTCLGFNQVWTHRLFAPNYSGIMQALTYCGRSAASMPGRGDIDCPECLKYLSEVNNGDS
jgi:hypothetical protein